MVNPTHDTIAEFVGSDLDVDYKDVLFIHPVGNYDGLELHIVVVRTERQGIVSLYVSTTGAWAAVNGDDAQDAAKFILSNGLNKA